MSEMNVQSIEEPSSSSGRASSSRPTLFNLLEVLANDSITTPSQRQCIRDIVTEFLANKFEHSKVYSYIGAVVGHDRLHAVIKQLESDPDRVPLPDQNGLMRIESAFNLSRSYKNGTPSAASRESKGSLSSLSYASSSKDDILRSIRRNLNAKRAADGDKGTGTRTASAGVLLQKACWLPIRRSLTAGPLYGHSLICIGSRAYLMGGSNGRSQGLNLSKAHVVNLVDFSSKQIVFSGEVPSHREGNSCNVAIIQQAHAIIIFGGFNGERFFNDVYILDLEKRKWSRKLVTGRAPAPRDEHSALVYPARCEAVQRGTGASYLFIFGGKTGLRNQFQCLNDLWAYNITNSLWHLVETDETKPSARFGVCALWADDDTICVFGGETASASGFVNRSERCLLDDLWMFHLNTPLSGTWSNVQYEGNIGPRSHYSSIFIAQRCKELNTGVPKTIERLMLLTGGLTYSSGAKKNVVASDKLYFYFFSQRRWYSLKPNYPRNYVGEPFEPRQLHVACFFEKRNILFPGTKPSVPCIFFHGGFHRKNILSDAWVLSLTGEDLFLKNSVLSPVDALQSRGNVRDVCMYPPWYYRESHSPDVLWALCSEQRWAFGAIAHLLSNSLKDSVSSSRIQVSWNISPHGDEGMLSVQDDGNGLDYAAMNKLLKLFGQSKTGERSPNYEYGCGFKMAYARLASSCAVMSRTHDSIGIGMLSLELMGQCESREMAAPMCMWKLPSKELINRDGACMVDQRHHQRLLMSYSPFNSAALLADQINVLGTNPGTRILFWQLRTDLDEIYYSKKEQTLMLRSFHDMEHGSSDHNDVYPEELTVTPAECSPLYLAPKDDKASSTSVDDKAELHNPCSLASESIADTTGDHTNPVEESNEKSVNQDKDTQCVESIPHPISGNDVEMEVLKCNDGMSSNSENPPVNSETSGSTYPVEGTDASSLQEKAEQPQQTVLPRWRLDFPLWRSGRYSMDYCLPIYLYWLHLYSTSTIVVQDYELMPVGVIGDEVDNVGNYSCTRVGCSYCGVSPITRSMNSGSLYFYLKKRLYNSVELPFLFSPSDHSNGCFALFGFLNPPVKEDLSKLDEGGWTASSKCSTSHSENDSPTHPGCHSSEGNFCEAGILLYFKGRLISRLEGHFPASLSELDSSSKPPKESLFSGELYRFALTAIVSVPDWLIPTVSKQEFIHENNRVYFEFKSKLLKLIAEYCRVCADEQKRKNWENSKVQELINYDNEVNPRNKRNIESDEEILPNWDVNNEQVHINPNNSEHNFHNNNEQ